jgi:transposase
MGRKNDIYDQIIELTHENEKLCKENKKLRAENSDLRAENVRIRKRIEVLEATLEERIAKAVDEAVSKAVAPLHAIIAEKDKEILRLKSQINKDSANSSKPSGSNGFKKIPNNREKSDRKQGGQHGHQGTRLNIPKNLDELVANGKAKHIVVTGVADGAPYVSDWYVDIEVTVIYTEHRRALGKPPKVEYGTQLKAMAVYLCVVGLIAYKRLAEFFCEITNGLIRVSKASLAGFNCAAANNINLEPYVNGLLNGKVIGVDETPIKTSERPNGAGVLETAEKTTFNAYIRTYSNKTATILTANPFKTEESVITDNILTRFHGIVSQDHESKFYNFGDSNATCGAHLTRELKGMTVLQMLSWAEEVRQFFLEMNKHKNTDVQNGKISCEHGLLCQFESRYDELVQLGKGQLEAMTPKSFGYDELRRMVNRLEKHTDNYMLFMRDYDAPFTNNISERDLRHCKTQQKVSGCFRSWQGVLDYCKIRSLISTSKKRGINLFEALTQLFVSPIPVR